MNARCYCVFGMLVPFLLLRRCIRPSDGFAKNSYYASIAANDFQPFCPEAGPRSGQPDIRGGDIKSNRNSCLRLILVSVASPPDPYGPRVSDFGIC